jgi:uncharacterized membrane protein
LFVLRLLLAALLLVALWLPYVSQTGSHRNFIMLCDVSDSVTLLHARSGSDALTFYRQEANRILEQMAGNDRLAVVFFADGAEIAVPFVGRSGMPAHLPTPTISGLASRLDQGLQLAGNLLRNSDGSVLLYCDGRIPAYILSACQEALLAVPWALRVLPAWPIDFPPVNDVSIETLVLPLTATRHSQVSGYADCYTTQPGDFRVRIYASKILCYEETVRLHQSGTFRISFGFSVRAEEREEVEAVVESLSFSDVFSANNRFVGRFRVSGVSRILWIGETAPAWTSRFACHVVSPQEAASVMENLDSFQAVVISAGDASQIAPYSEKILVYVRQGGGLLVCGSPTTLGLGHYGGTILEQALPVWCTPQQEADMALLTLLDVSGSMGEKIAATSKIELAKEALWQLWRRLPADAWLSLMVFRDSPHMVIPFTPCKQLANSGKLLDNITVYGSTHLAPALRTALGSMSQSAAKRRLILLISDGLASEPPDTLRKLARSIGESDIALAIVSTGDDKSGLLQLLAQEAGGNYRQAGSNNLEECLLQQIEQWQGSMLASGPALVRVVPGPIWQNVSAIGDGFLVNQWIRVQPKTWGLVAAVNDRQEALLVAGFYGLGRSAVLTTGFAPLWGGTWMERFAAELGPQLLSWLIEPQRATSGVSMVYRDNDVKISATMYANGEPRHNEEWQVLHSESGQQVLLNEIGSGRYEGIFPLAAAGNGRLALQRKEQDTWRTYAVWEVVRSYSAEWQRVGWQPLALDKSQAKTAGSGTAEPFLWPLYLTASLFFIESWLRLRRTRYGIDQNYQAPFGKT